MKTEEKNIYLIDGTSLCYRAFYAIRELTTSKGMPTNAIYGFISIVRKLIKDHVSGRMVMVFDLPGSTVRHEKFAEYKIHRKPMPEELVEQIPRIKDVIRAYGIPICELAGYEADDIIATLAETAKNRGMDVTIVTPDKDAMQLVDGRVKVLNLHGPEERVYGPIEVREKFGVDPSAMPDLMALMGDTSDNIPGVKGIGQVTASKLVKEYGSLKSLYEQLDKISSDTLKKKLEAGRGIAELSLELVTLDRHVPVETDVEGLLPKAPDIDRLSKLFREFEFMKLLREISPRTEEGILEHKVLCSDEDVRAALDRIKLSKEAVFCSVGIPGSSGLGGVAFSIGSFEAVFFPNRGVSGRTLKDILEDEGIRKIGHDIKNEIRVLRGAGMGIEGPFFDVMIADYLVDPSVTKHDLSSIAVKMGGSGLEDRSKIDPVDETGQVFMDLSCRPGYEVTEGCQKADLIRRIHVRLERELEEKDLASLFYEVEMPLVNVLVSMEEDGVALNTNYLKLLSSDMERKLDEVTSRVYALAGEEFNINSPKQLQKVLFEKLRLAPGRRTKTGASTDESVLKNLAVKHELPRCLLEYRELSKLKSAYYDSLLSLVDPDTGILQARFNQAVTATGRLSSSEPNLQNMPIKTERGREIRRAFIPRSPERSILAADYSQIELRILAHLSGDEKLIGAFSKGEDVHRSTASLIFAVPTDQVDDRMRSAAKTVNFGVIYGMGPYKLASDLEISVREAEAFIASYFGRYEGVRDFIETTIDRVRKDGFVTTLLNRRRYIPEINAKNERIRSFAERIAVNTPVQGSAADLIKIAMIRVFNRLHGEDARMIIQVHDELVFDVPKISLQEIAGEVRKIMESVMDLKVPLKVDVEAGPNWCDMEKIAA